MNELFENIKNEVLEKLSQLSNGLSPLERLNESNTIVGNARDTLKETLNDYQFESDDVEIKFFKLTNPQILSHSIVEVLRYNIMINKPINTNEKLADYYEEELRALHSFFRQNNFHYQYYKNEFKELDKVYFLRNSGPLSIPLPDIPNCNNFYCTAMSCLFAKFIAYERVQYLIINEITLTKKLPPLESILHGSDEVLELKWTGDIVNIVELAYGIWLTGQVNNGNASLNQIVRWLEDNLDVSIGIVQKKFTEIERRKRLSITKFLDQMKQAILNKIENNNS